MEMARVRLRKPTRVFTFLCRDIPLNRDEACIVRSDRGLEYGTCVTPPEPCSDSLEQRLKMNVVRKVTPADEQTLHQIQLDEKQAHELCARKIQERQLAMKLVDVEYTFDKHKAVFYFTAAERVDFRQLVRDLAHDLRTRIELRHIQVRDEAKLIGGIGMCGRTLCCSTWLREFHPISMKMAKRQNLSLNPSKISGQCGRLLCCLSYENEVYVPKKRGGVEAPQPAAIEGAEPDGWEYEAQESEFETLGDLGREVDMDLDLDTPQPSAVVELGVVDAVAEETFDPPAGAASNGCSGASAGSGASASGGEGQPQAAPAQESQAGSPHKHRRRRRKRHSPR